MRDDTKNGCVVDKVTPLGGPTFLYIFVRPASMETVGACGSAAVLGAGKDPGGILPYISHFGMCRPKDLGSMHRFGLKMGTDFVHFGLESGTGFVGATDVSERIYRFNSKRVRKKEKYANSKLILRKLFRLLSLMT